VRPEASVSAAATVGAAARAASPAAVPVVASAALAGLLTGRPARGVVLAAGPHAAYLDVAGELVAVLAATASRIPCAVRLAPGAAAPSAWCAAGDPVDVGDRMVVLRGARLRVARWWDPAPALPPLTAEGLRAWRSAVAAVATWRAPGLAADPGGSAAVAALGRALADGAGAGAVAAAGGLVGRGSGSTPAGDDVLAGAVVGARLLAAAVIGPAAPAALALWDGAGRALAGHLTATAASRTTPLSAALLRHAAAGRPLGELADVLRAAARGPIEPALLRLAAVGHTSGRDLLTGLVLAVDAVLAPREEPR
jgi:hypothetical protein